MFSNLRDWWRKQDFRKAVERAGKALARQAWGDIKELVINAATLPLSGPGKYNYVERELKRRYKEYVLTAEGEVAQWVKPAIRLAVSLLPESITALIK